MIYDFLFDCKCAIKNEVTDFQEVLRSFVKKKTCVGFMPAIIDDLYPVFALSCTEAKFIISPNVYIIPIGAHDFCAKPHFEEIINSFYQNDEFQEQYNIELDEMLLLNNLNLNSSFSLSDGTEYNVVLCRITLPSETEVALIIVLETPDECWNKVIEPYKVKCDIVIDSHKGMGNWFDSIPLYKVMRETNATNLLPHYYFRGLYISHDAPRGFKLFYTIPDKIYYPNREREIADWQKEIYVIDWDENKRCLS